MNILVLCTGNSARSIILEHILNQRGAGRVTAFSAGSAPAGHVHPQSYTLLEDRGHDTSQARSKSWGEFAGPDAPVMDIVITVCSSAAGETCPFWPGAPIRAHWGVDDPAAVPEEDWENAFQTVYDILDQHATEFLNLPLDASNRTEIKAALDRIGAQ